VTVKLIESDPSPSSEYASYIFIIANWSDRKKDMSDSHATNLVDEDHNTLY
jgi:hypothetical protein